MKVYGLLLSLLLSGPLFAYQLEGVEIPESVVVRKDKIQLDLLGAGVRTKFFVNVYVGAFYADETLKTPIEAVDENVPKRMHFYFLHKVNAQKMQDAWKEGIRANNDAQAVLSQQDDVKRFLEMLNQPMQSGDQLILDYTPQQGTKVVLNGSVKGIFPGKPFNDLILKTWMGKEPPSKKFQTALLSFQK